jgi:DNA-binding MarR family transcriptional regulator
MKVDLKLTDGCHLLAILAEAFRAMMAARSKELEPSGVSMKRATALWSVEAMDRPATASEVAVVLNRDHHTALQLLKRMEKDGLLKRHDALSKNKALSWVLTEQGKEALQKSLQDHVIIEDIVSCLSREEKEALMKYLERLRDRAIAMTTGASRFPVPIASKLGVRMGDGHRK